ncbi:unnamed protein product [[Candida] boidinii]|uniref:Unnamed protein product n=1 Tax=Candida boidinii TaxID=5477 RepID=A0ACB5U8P5_CANBO|nr:unnamed protein product [[Candida] boidinii]
MSVNNNSNENNKLANGSQEENLQPQSIQSILSPTFGPQFSLSNNTTPNQQQQSQQSQQQSQPQPPQQQKLPNQNSHSPNNGTTLPSIRNIGVPNQMLPPAPLQNNSPLGSPMILSADSSMNNSTIS